MRSAAFAALLSIAACSGERPRPRLALEPCHLGTSGSTARLSARCGVFTVLEDRSRPDGPAIGLRVAVIPALSRNPENDPLLFLTGGPGQAATETYPNLAPAFRAIQRDRDVVLVDQRGTGGSNALRCPSGREGEAEDPALLEEAAIGPWISRCLASLPGDPRFYTTSIAVEDLDEVREALGYERVNLYGLSYGTRVASTYLRRFPHRVRLAILDGVVPPTETLGLDVARDAERAIDLILSRCASDEECRAAFPDLRESLDHLMKQLETPAAVRLRHPRTGETEEIQFSRQMAAYAIRLLSYSQETASIVPLLLNAASRSDLAPLAAQFRIVTERVGETIAEGMGIAIVCSEDFPFLTEAASSAFMEGERDRGTYLGTFQTDTLKLVCPRWPRGEVPSDFKNPVPSKAPVLLLSGEADPVTPPENGELTASQLGKDVSLHLVARGQGHLVIHRGCIPRLAAEFVASGTFAGLDARCVSEIAPQPFFLGYNGPAP